MANRSSDKSASDGTCLKSLLTTISIAQIAGGTAHWWWDKLFPPELVVTQIPVETTETTDTIFVEGILEMIFPPWTTVYLEFVQQGDNVSCDFLYLLEKGTETIDAVFGGTVCDITGKTKQGYLPRFEYDNGAIVTRQQIIHRE